MPQLDVLMFPSQSLFIFVYLIGYLIFLKYILPILSFELKMKELVELNYLYWFDKNINLFVSSYGLSEFFVFHKLQLLLNSFLSLTNIKRVVYGFVYSYDLLFLRSKFQKKTTQQLF